MEIITGIERRRHWRPGEKLRILAELDKPGTKFVDVARRHEVSRGLLWQWRDAQRRGMLMAEEATFVPVRIVRELPAPASPAGPTASVPCADPAAHAIGAQEHDPRPPHVLLGFVPIRHDRIQTGAAGKIDAIEMPVRIPKTLTRSASWKSRTGLEC